MKRSSLLLAAGAALLGGCAPVTPAPAPIPAPAIDPAATITAADMYARIAFLSDDLLRGRDTPSPGLEIAAAYLVNQHRVLGLQPAGENGTFYQWYPFPLRQLDATGAVLRVQGPRQQLAFQLGRDFFARGGTTTAVNAPLVWVGLGEEKLMGEGSLRDKVAVAALPGAYTRDWRIERNRQAERARNAGAVGIIHVVDNRWPTDTIAAYARNFGAPARVLGGAAPGFPQFFLSYDAAQRLFAAGDVSLADAWREAAAGNGKGITLSGLNLTLGLPQRALDRAVAPNVVAMLLGSDPLLRDEYIVVSAHMDHVGVGQPVNGDSIYNGADDDGSGTAALLELAQAFASSAVPTRRSIVFLHVSGEEKGLLGSEWYSDHPTLPLENIVANVNIDMIGRNNPDSVVVIGKDFSTLGGTVNRVRERHPELNLVAADDIWPEERFFFRSDHFNFARKEVPAIFFFSGVHPDYHQPSDEVDKIDTDKAARITRFVYYLVEDIANADARPQWDPAGLAEIRSLTR